jgi:hypothetical protein
VVINTSLYGEDSGSNLDSWLESSFRCFSVGHPKGKNLSIERVTVLNVLKLSQRPSYSSDYSSFAVTKAGSELLCKPSNAELTMTGTKQSLWTRICNICTYIALFLDSKTEITADYADLVTPSIRKSWHSFRRQSAVAQSV